MFAAPCSHPGRGRCRVWPAAWLALGLALTPLGARAQQPPKATPDAAAATPTKAPADVSEDVIYTPERVSRWGLGIGFGTAAVTGAIAMTLTFAANNVGRDSKALRTETATEGGLSACYQPAPSLADRCADLQRELGEKDQLTNSAVALWIIAGASMLGTGIYATVAALSSDDSSPPGAQSPSAAELVPLVGPGVAGLGVHGKF